MIGIEGGSKIRGEGEGRIILRKRWFQCHK